jgi:lipopolysaccharide/colanic/teichoic acid biosynthesis glycosyltransferase
VSLILASVDDSGDASDLRWVARFPDRGDPAERRWFRVAKRAFDLVVVAATMPIWIAAIAVIALMVMIDSPGAAPLFVQTRRGRGGVRFPMLKLRTMVPNAAAMKHSLLHLNELPWPDFKIRNDPRATQLGRVLRRTSLDELPQLFNVLVGQMSLVGPRPISAPVEASEFSLNIYPTAAPGLTGLWQIHGRGSVGLEERLLLDLLYCRRCCFKLDLEILLRSIPAVLSGRGAM